jgi:hypothetical protein
LGAPLIRDAMITYEDDDNYGFGDDDYGFWYSFHLEGVLLG